MATIGSSHVAKVGAGSSVTRHGGNDEQFSGGNVNLASRAFAGMEGGAGEFSYTRNSRVQSQAVGLLKPVLEKEIGELMNVDDGGSTVIRVADFGCSMGPNTIQYAEMCFQAVQEKWSRLGKPPPVVQYYFSDLPSNDFNTLFRHLEDWRKPGGAAMEEFHGRDRKSTSFFAAAVPGSFHNRLLPPGSIHVAISVLAVHWMSQIPVAVVDRGCAAYNKGRVWIDNAENFAAFEAYAQTGRQDLRNFFLARADEVVSGGVVILYALGREDVEISHGEKSAQPLEDGGPFNKVFEAAWEDLVVEGVIDEEKRDSFNLPVYWHSLDEVRTLAESTNAFHIKRLELERQSYLSPDEVEALLAAPERYGLFAKNFARTLVNSYVVDHIGERSAAELFDRLERNAATAAREKRVSSLFLDCILAVLVRK